MILVRQCMHVIVIVIVSCELWTLETRAPLGADSVVDVTFYEVADEQGLHGDQVFACEC